MKGIGGNLKAIIQVCTTAVNDIGEHVQTWADVQTIKGWLDLSSGEARFTTYHAKIQESTHIFISDYVSLDSRITAETSQMVINGKRYDILLIDNPMELGTGSQLEFYLKFTGGQ
jgi:hypothetical protein